MRNARRKGNRVEEMINKLKKAKTVGALARAVAPFVAGDTVIERERRMAMFLREWGSRCNEARSNILTQEEERSLLDMIQKDELSPLEQFALFLIETRILLFWLDQAVDISQTIIKTSRNGARRHLQGSDD